MAKKAILSNMGVDIKKATIIKIKKNEGDKVNRGDIIAEVESDKATFEVVAPASGKILKLFYGEDEEVKVGETVALIGDEEEDISEYILEDDMKKNKVNAKEVESKKEKQEIKDEVQIKAYPAVKKLAKKLDVSLIEVNGSGPGGVITKEDVKKHADVQKEEVIPLSGVRGTIAQRMTESLQTAAHVTTIIEADMTSVKRKRKQILEEENAKLSFLSFIINAACEAIDEVPIINSLIEDNKIIKKKKINFSIAVGTEKGLFVPVIKEVENKNLYEINENMQKVVELARKNQLKPEDMKNGTITISNAGTFGPILNTPIINQPQVAIIWTGRIRKKPVVRNGGIVVRDMMYICLSYDHRALDGRDAGIFLNHMKENLEENF